MSVASLSVTTVRVLRSSYAHGTSAAGGIVQSRAEVFKVKARVQPISAMEQLRVGRMNEDITHRVYVAGTPDIRPGDRLVVDSPSIKMDVKTVRDIDTLGKFLTIDCVESEHQNL